METTGHVDVLIVGAGISGIGAACHLRRELPGKSYAILERRENVGGTWDLFRYPGIRSDSDMFTFGYGFRPWPGTKVLADGPSIREYVNATADEYGVRSNIKHGLQVRSADFSTDDNRWTVQALREATGQTETYTCTFLLVCTGYYNYDTGFRPEFPGQSDFGGQLIHPQHWPEDLDYDGKRVVIIGSGATAITLVPAMARAARHVTMLQRSPSYVVALPAVDYISAALRKVLPEPTVGRLARRRYITMQRATYTLARKHPNAARRFVLAGARIGLGRRADLSAFTPTYDPWDQRLCVVPNGDLFRTIRRGDADVVTATIDRFVPAGIRLTGGRELPADIIITATGLDMQMLGGASLSVDGRPVPLASTLTYKGVLASGVPNLAVILGYINASWTLKVDLACAYLCRLLRHMDASGYTRAVAHATPADVGTTSIMDELNSGYVRRGAPHLPRQGVREPWIVHHDYTRDRVMLQDEPIEDGVLELTRSGEAAGVEAWTEQPAAATD